MKAAKVENASQEGTKEPEVGVLGLTWNAFQTSIKGQGLSKEEISAKYKAQKIV